MPTTPDVLRRASRDASHAQMMGQVRSAEASRAAAASVAAQTAASTDKPADPAAPVQQTSPGGVLLP
jgi:hypothetical protein